MRTVLLLFVALAIITGCGSSVTKAEYDKLLQENTELRAQLEKIKYGSEALMNTAKAYIGRSDLHAAKTNLETIISTHASSKEFKEAQELLVKVNQSIKEKNDLAEKEAAEKAKLEKERLSNAVKNLRSSTDDMVGITWRYDKQSPSRRNVNSFYIYMGQRGSGAPLLRFCIQYKSDEWLFIEQYLIKTDNESYVIDANNKVERDNGYGGIWEWYDTIMTEEIYTMIKDIIKSKTTKIRCNGKRYYSDRIITKIEKQGLTNVLEAYEALGGNFNF